jgi:hypothetical protein
MAPIATATPAAAIMASRVASAAAVTSAGSMAAVAAMAGNGRLPLAAQQSETNHREEDRDAKHQCTIHSALLQKQVPYR